jgi:hypothetical protein
VIKVLFFPRSIINFGGFGGSVLDVVQSFGPNKCLENIFMQGFIDCIREDDVLYNPDSVINTLILNVNVGVIFSLQLCILLQHLLYKYIILINLFFCPDRFEYRGVRTAQFKSPALLNITS